MQGAARFSHQERLASGVAELLDGIHFHPAEPRSFLFMLTRRF